MKFHKAKTDGILNPRYVSEDCSYEVGVFPVMYGWRIRGGQIGAGWVDIDYCCAQNLDLLAATLAVCIAKLEALPRLDSRLVNQILPYSQDKLFRDRPLLKRLGLVQFLR